MKIIEKIKKLDNSEKDFLLITLAFFLVAIFLLIIGFFQPSLNHSTSRVYFGYSDVNIEALELNEIQKMSCRYAEQYNTCDKLEETLIITKQICCIKEEKCCNG